MVFVKIIGIYPLDTEKLNKIRIQNIIGKLEKLTELSK